MKFLIVAALVAVATAAPQQPFAYKAQPFQSNFAYQKPAVVATITKTVTKPVTYQVPVATITRNSAQFADPTPLAVQTVEPVKYTTESAKYAAEPFKYSAESAKYSAESAKYAAEPFKYSAEPFKYAQPQYTSQAQYTAQPQYAAKQLAQPVVAILKLERSQEPSGDYSYFYQADNGIQASEKAVIKAVRDEKNEEHYVPNVEGSYSYTGPDGVQYTVNYVADEYGYRASGAHLPVPPAIPEEIQRSIQLNAAAEQQPAQKFN